MLKNKTVLVTGSTSGIGLAIATAFAANGCNVCINGFGTAEDITAILNSLKTNYNVKAIYHGADLSKPDEIVSLINYTEAELGPVDILVNNAGIQYVSPIEDFPEEKYEAIIRINLSSAFYTIKHTLPKMKQRKWGRIINIASAHALVASPFKSAYVAAKHGVLGLTKSIALEAAEFGITCNAICPGYVLTQLVEGQIKNTALARGISEDAVIKDVMLANQPTKEFVKVQEVADLAVYLSQNAAASITGTSLSIDGGWTAH